MSRRVDSAHDLHEADGDENLHGSLEKLAPAARPASKFDGPNAHKEVSAFPKTWNRESQSGYKGRRVLGLDGDEKRIGPLVAYATNSNGAGSYKFPEFELPQRYAGKRTSYQGETPVPLAGNHNSWTPPRSKRRLCGLRKWTFWLIIIIIFLVVICASVGGIFVGIESARKASSARANSYAMSTEVSSATSTITMANGVVVVTTHIFTSLRTITAGTTTSQVAIKNPAVFIVTPSPEDINTAATTLSPSPFTNQLSSSSPSTSSTLPIVIFPSTTTTTTSSISTSTLLPLACPSLNGTTASTSISAQIFTYTILCNTAFPSQDQLQLLSAVNATSLLDCYSACAQYTHSQPGTCTVAVFHANLSSVEVIGGGGNCNLKSGVAKGGQVTGPSELVAAAVLMVGEQGGSAKGVWVGTPLMIPVG